MADTFTIRLQRGATIVDLPGPKMGTPVRAPAQFVTGQTVDGTRFSYKTHNSARRLWTLPLKTLSAAQKSALESFFYTTVSGPGLSFTYTHTNGASYTAQFVSSRLEFTRRNSIQWDVSLQIETTAAVS